MIRVGVIGLGMMGNTHLDVYSKRGDVEVVAISDLNPDRLSGKVKAAGNVEGQAQGAFDLSKVKRIPEGKDLIKDKSIDLVDICLPTPLHAEYAIKALRAGKHVLTEKPMGRTFKDAAKLAKFAATRPNQHVMVAMCMRFWPGWTWLKETVEKQTYGPVRAAHFRRVAQHPGGPFYLDGEQCGGAILDLHIHDTDFVQYVFGVPGAVRSAGYSKITGKTDHVLTHYLYDNGPLVFAEGAWCMSPGFGFSMTYNVNFERATAIFDLAAKDPLVLVENGQRKPVALEAKMGYELEIDYFLNCIKTNQKPTVVTLESAANSVKIVDAEVKSIATGKPVKIK